jgi:NAD(P)-dependent dehydrogenase (short-subunit alcohol dehydrogenase family)
MIETLNKFILKDKVAVVTGALGLLGKHHCYALAEAGANVIVCDLDQSLCDEFAWQLPTESFGFQIDVTNPDELQNLKKHIAQNFGKLDILVNNAAINDKVENNDKSLDLSKFENFPLDLWNRTLKVNVNSVFLCSQILGTLMLEQKKGSIINIASTYGVVAPDQKLYINGDGIQMFYKSPAYPVSKAAIISFTKFLASYWGAYGIRVNSLSPGGVKNNQDDYFVSNYSRRTPLERMANPDEFQGALVFLASDASSYVTGANIIVDGGWTIC